jgi:hypothetical protein
LPFLTFFVTFLVKQKSKRESLGSARGLVGGGTPTKGEGDIGWCRTPTKGERFQWLFCLCHPYGVLQVLFHVFLLPYNPFGVLGDCAHSAGGGVSFGIANSEERFGWWRNTNQRQRR